MTDSSGSGHLYLVNGGGQPEGCDDAEIVFSTDPDVLDCQIAQLLEESYALLQAGIPEGSIRPPVRSRLFSTSSFGDALESIALLNGREVDVVTPFGVFGGTQREVYEDHVELHVTADANPIYRLDEATFKGASWELGPHDVLRLEFDGGAIEVHRAD